DLKVTTENQIVRIALPENRLEKIKDNAVESNVEVLRTRLNRLSVEEITIARQGNKNIIVELPDVSDPQQAKEMIGRSAVLEFKLVEKFGRTADDILYELDGILPGDKEILPGQEHDGKPMGYYLVSKFAEVTGKDLRDAYPQFDESKRQPVVVFKFTSEGGD